MSVDNGREACRPCQLNASRSTPLANAAEDTRLDGPMRPPNPLLIAQVQAGNDLMMLSERLVSSMNRDLVKQLDKSPLTGPSRDALESAVAVGGCAYESMSKATRQVNQFACTNMSAALDARSVKHARKHLSGTRNTDPAVKLCCRGCAAFAALDAAGWPGVCGVE